MTGLNKWKKFLKENVHDRQELLTQYIQALSKYSSSPEHLKRELLIGLEKEFGFKIVESVPLFVKEDALEDKKTRQRQTAKDIKKKEVQDANQDYHRRMSALAESK